MNISSNVHQLRLRAAFALGAILLLCSTSVTAKMLYVDARTGSDSTTYDANSTSNPWATLGRAAWGSTNRTAPNASQAAQAGDTVIVRAGTYTTTGTNTRHTPAYNPVNAGTVGSPITFQAEGAVVLRYSSGIGPVIGTNARNYITWRGFTVDEALAPAASDTGPVVLWDAVGGVIEYCDIDGNNTSFGSGELHNGVRINAGGGHIVRHNYIHDFRNSGSGANASAILVDQSAGGLVEHNEIANSDGVFFIKRSYNAPGRWIVRYNYGRDSWGGIRADQLVRSANSDYTVEIYQNLLVNIAENAFATNHYDGAETYYLRIVNNTVKNCGRAFEGAQLTANAGHIFQNNIFVDCQLGFRSQDSSSAWTPATFVAKHNLYRGMTTGAQFRFELSGQSSLSFAAWQAMGQDSASPASRIADPLFMGELSGNFRLQTGSPARNGGVDILDLNGNGSRTDAINLGAYITGNEVIGRSTTSTPTPTPEPPTDVTVE